MKRKPTKTQRRATAVKLLADMQRQYDRSERALVRAALVGCLSRDPSMESQSEASSSGREVDLAREVSKLRWDRNHLTWAERDLRTLERAEAAAKRMIRAETKRMKRD